MQITERECLRNRAELVMMNLRLCNSGAEIHEVGNMRNVAVFIVDQTLQPDADLPTLHDMVCRLEKQSVVFFKKKFHGVTPRSDGSRSD
jgi:hypothetical protein